MRIPAKPNTDSDPSRTPRIPKSERSDERVYLVSFSFPVNPDLVFRIDGPLTSIL
jgi:hypothetical protein